MSLFTKVNVRSCDSPCKAYHQLTLELEIVGGPALLKCHNISHRVTPTNFSGITRMLDAWKTDANLPYLEIPNLVPFRSVMD